MMMDFWGKRLDREFDDLRYNSTDSYNNGYNIGYDEGQSAGLKEGLRTGVKQGSYDRARKIAFRLKELNLLTLEQISQVTGVPECEML